MPATRHHFATLDRAVMKAKNGESLESVAMPTGTWESMPKATHHERIPEDGSRCQRVTVRVPERVAAAQP